MAGILKPQQPVVKTFLQKMLRITTILEVQSLPSTGKNLQDSRSKC